MSRIELNEFTIAGISVRTTNENGQSAVDIRVLWDRFYSGNIADQITGKLDQHLYCVYSDYERDHSKPYTATIGFRVNPDFPVKEGYCKTHVLAGSYQRFAGKGKIAEGLVYGIWEEIWNCSLVRTYIADFEKYSPDQENPEMALVEVFVRTG